jgi:hypothetical protein
MHLNSGGQNFAAQQCVLLIFWQRFQIQFDGFANICQRVLDGRSLRLASFEFRAPSVKAVSSFSINTLALRVISFSLLLRGVGGGRSGRHFRGPAGTKPPMLRSGDQTPAGLNWLQRERMLTDRPKDLRTGQERESLGTPLPRRRWRGKEMPGRRIVQ